MSRVQRTVCDLICVLQSKCCNMEHENINHSSVSYNRSSWKHLSDKKVLRDWLWFFMITNSNILFQQQSMTHDTLWAASEWFRNLFKLSKQLCIRKGFNFFFKRSDFYHFLGGSGGANYHFFSLSRNDFQAILDHKIFSYLVSQPPSPQG